MLVGGGSDFLLHLSGEHQLVIVRIHGLGKPPKPRVQDGRKVDPE
jgi:hypothetical protein